MKITTMLVAFSLLLACSNKKELNTLGSIERTDAALNAIIDSDAVIEIIGEGFEWSEGPVWIDDENMLLFSDVPKNTVYKWTEAGGTEIYLTPSGFSGETTQSREPGSNGLVFHEGALFLCQHGNRQIAKMNASVANPKPDFITVAGTYNGKRFNSPNDAAFRNNGVLYFTDPPYGLADQDSDTEKELIVNGVYGVNVNGEVYLKVDSLTRPNGIAFMPGGNKFLVANSDSQKAMWYEFELNEKDEVISSRIFYNATAQAATEKGLPDGLKIDSQGNVFATGPGGVWIFDSTGKLLGKIKLPEASANCTFSPDEKILYITADMYLLRVTLRK
jgi:gluconolactonase